MEIYSLKDRNLDIIIEIYSITDRKLDIITKELRWEKLPIKF